MSAVLHKQNTVQGHCYYCVYSIADYSPSTIVTKMVAMVYIE